MVTVWRRCLGGAHRQQSRIPSEQIVTRDCRLTPKRRFSSVLPQAAEWGRACSRRPAALSREASSRDRRSVRASTRGSPKHTEGRAEPACAPGREAATSICSARTPSRAARGSEAARRSCRVVGQAVGRAGRQFGRANDAGRGERPVRVVACQSTNRGRSPLLRGEVRALRRWATLGGLGRRACPLHAQAALGCVDASVLVGAPARPDAARDALLARIQIARSTSAERQFGATSVSRPRTCHQRSIMTSSTWWAATWERSRTLGSCR